MDYCRSCDLFIYPKNHEEYSYIHDKNYHDKHLVIAVYPCLWINKDRSRCKNICTHYYFCKIHDKLLPR